MFDGGIEPGVKIIRAGGQFASVGVFRTIHLVKQNRIIKLFNSRQNWSKVRIE